MKKYPRISEVDEELESKDGDNPSTSNVHR